MSWTSTKRSRATTAPAPLTASRAILLEAAFRLGYGVCMRMGGNEGLDCGFALDPCGYLIIDRRTKAPDVQVVEITGVIQREEDTHNVSIRIHAKTLGQRIPLMYGWRRTGN